MKTSKGPHNGKLYTEEDWNDESKPDMEGGYRYSKVSPNQVLTCQHPHMSALLPGLSCSAQHSFCREAPINQ